MHFTLSGRLGKAGKLLHELSSKGRGKIENPLLYLKKHFGSVGWTATPSTETNGAPRRLLDVHYRHPLIQIASSDDSTTDERRVDDLQLCINFFFFFVVSLPFSVSLVQRNRKRGEDFSVRKDEILNE